MNNYDLPTMRKTLIKILASTLKKSSKFYKDDFDSICKAVNAKNRKDLIDSLALWKAVVNVSQSEIDKHCQLQGLSIK